MTKVLCDFSHFAFYNQQTQKSGNILVRCRNFACHCINQTTRRFYFTLNVPTGITDAEMMLM